jgi:hypothetical protein
VFISFLEISIINFATAQVVILQAVEMDYLRRNARKSKLETVPDEEIRRIMQAEGTVLDRIEGRKLRWFGHVTRMPEERWPALTHSWIPPGRRKRGRPRCSWRDGVTEAMKRMWLRKEDAQDSGGEDWEGGGLPYKPINI